MLLASRRHIATFPRIENLTQRSDLSLFRSFLSAKGPASQEGDGSTDYSRVPLFEKIATLLVDPTPLISEVRNPGFIPVKRSRHRAA